MISINVKNSKKWGAISTNGRKKCRSHSYACFSIFAVLLCDSTEHENAFSKWNHDVLYLWQIQKERDKFRSAARKGTACQNENFKYDMQWTVKWCCHRMNIMQNWTVFIGRMRDIHSQRTSACHPHWTQNVAVANYRINGSHLNFHHFWNV